MGILKANKYIEKNKSEVNGTYRNKFHLMPPIGWMNDPNGFIFYKGQYHLFYQFYPYDSVWGPMHWGHAVSDDGINWKDLPVALAPDQPYDKGGCFSGTAYVVDDVLYLAYTGHTDTDGEVRQVQCLAKSEDGINFEKFPNNPVVSDKHIEGLCSISDFRDPKVIKRDDLYYMIVAANTEDKRGQLLIFESNDMNNWSKGKVFLEGDKSQGIMWECPDVFELDGKDVIIMSPIQMPSQGHKYTNISSTIAVIGSINWDKLEFEIETYHEIDRGTDFYAPQSLLNDKNERIMTSWMQMWDRTSVTHELNHKWIGSMVLPRVVNIVDNYYVQKPIPTIYDNLNITEKVIELSSSSTLIGTDLNYIYAKFKENEEFKFKLSASEDEFIELSYENNLLTLSRENAGYVIEGNEGKGYHSRSLELEEDLSLDIFIDTSSVEVFINEKYTMSMLYFKKENKREFYLEGTNTTKNIKIGRLK